jgi:hypothetical protein
VWLVLEVKKSVKGRKKKTTKGIVVFLKKATPKPKFSLYLLV